MAAILLMAGCASGKPAIPFDKTSANHIKTIGLLSPGMPDGPSAALLNSVGQSFGLIGALIDSGMRSSRDGDMTTMLRAQDFSADAKLINELTENLKARGYEVTLIPVSRMTPELMTSYSAVQSAPVDAYLDVVLVGYGYVAAGVTSGTPYRPFINSQCKLVKASDGSVLMEDRVAYNASAPGLDPANRVTIEADPDYSFSDFDGLTSDPKKAVDGINLSFAKTAETIGGLLR